MFKSTLYQCKICLELIKHSNFRQISRLFIGIESWQSHFHSTKTYISFGNCSEGNSSVHLASGYISHYANSAKNFYQIAAYALSPYLRNYQNLKTYFFKNAWLREISWDSAHSQILFTLRKNKFNSFSWSPTYEFRTLFIGIGLLQGYFFPI